MSKLSKGIIGWLSPEGELTECKYGEHYRTSANLLSTIDSSDEVNLATDYIYFGFDPASECYTVHKVSELTESQLQWISSNSDKLSYDQLICLEFSNYM
ncbi:hypothetical protein LIS04_35 [Listeria phage LIS04]|nr:hypothetical protein LIS04_35 [Listeria phage LIS04]